MIRPEEKMPNRWDEEADIIIIGAGIAGLSAAIEAADQGVEAKVLEKSNILGGELIYTLTGGLLAASSCGLGIGDRRDSRDVHFDDVMKVSEGKSDPELLRAHVDGAPGIIDWMVGLEWKVKPEVEISHIFDSYPRAYKSAEKEKGISAVLVNAAKRKKLDIRSGTSATALFRDLQIGGRVVGLEAKNAVGKVCIKARRGIIVASGGFTNNPEMIEKYDPEVRGLPIAHPGKKVATGEGIMMLAGIGAKLRDMEVIELWACDIGPRFSWDRPWRPDVLCINDAGKRFFNEAVLISMPGVGRILMGEAMHKNKCKLGYFILNADQLPSSTSLLQRKIEGGECFRADRIEDLADMLQEKHGIPSATILKTINEYNHYCERGKDPEFNKPKEYCKKIEIPPFYAQMFISAIGHTYGGVSTNIESQVLDQQGRIIPGLYAAGNCVGGIHTPENGNCATSCILFGRKAGANAVKERA